jgi:hypothetical protein
MKFAVKWHPAHTAQVRNMNPWLAEAICKAIYAAAETGEGTIRRLRPDNQYRISIHVNGATAWADIDPEAETLTVLRLFANS